MRARKELFYIHQAILLVPFAVCRILQMDNKSMDKTDRQYKMNFLHRVFLGWLTSQISAGRVPATRQIADRAPIDLQENSDLFHRFLGEENLGEMWRQFEADHGPTPILTYFNG
jgi:hypothetical protein